MVGWNWDPWYLCQAQVADERVEAFGGMRTDSGIRKYLASFSARNFLWIDVVLNFGLCSDKPFIQHLSYGKAISTSWKGAPIYQFEKLDE
jgi:hypothetical protein